MPIDQGDPSIWRSTGSYPWPPSGAGPAGGVGSEAALDVVTDLLASLFSAVTGRTDSL